MRRSSVLVTVVALGLTVGAQSASAGSIITTRSNIKSAQAVNAGVIVGTVVQRSVQTVRISQTIFLRPAAPGTTRG